MKVNARLLIAIAITAAVVAVVSVFTLVHHATHHVLFKSAYLVYAASGYALFVPANGSLRIDVIDSNSTHYLIVIKSWLGGKESVTKVWVRNLAEAFVKALRKGDWELIGKHEEVITNPVAGDRECVVLTYRYVTQKKVVPTLKLYIDKQTDIPLRIEFSLGAYAKLQLDLRKTNIPQLKK